MDQTTRVVTNIAHCLGPVRGTTVHQPLSDPGRGEREVIRRRHVAHGAVCGHGWGDYTSMHCATHTWATLLGALTALMTKALLPEAEPLAGRPRGR